MSAELAVEAKIFQEDPEVELRYDLKTQFAELVDGSMLTDFGVELIGNDLIAEDGRSLGETSLNGLKDAGEVAKTNPSLWFERRRRSIERQEFFDLLEMAKGEGPNTKVIVSDFPAELMDSASDVGGYNVTRKQTMLRIFTRKSDGSMRMYSKTLDSSDRQALEAIYTRLGQPPEDGELLGQRINTDLDSDRQDWLVDELTAVYDETLSILRGGQWFAGRRPIDYRNTYDFVCQQEDIVEECIRLDKYGWLNRDVMYNMAATMNKRFLDDKQQSLYRKYDDLYSEAKLAGAEARAMGLTFSACGVTLGDSNLFEQAGYGMAGEDQYGSLSFKCPKGHNNIRPRGTLLNNCQHCGTSVKC